MIPFLKGKKTYIAAFGLVIAAITSWLSELDPTWLSLITNHATEVFEGLGLAGVRAGISKVGS